MMVVRQLTKYLEYLEKYPICIPEDVVIEGRGERQNK